MGTPKGILTRIDCTSAYTLGVLFIEGHWFCLTLEPPWKDNKTDVSCIPTGVYECQRIETEDYGLTFLVIGVKGRTEILFHVGNTVKDTKGCILLGATLSLEEEGKILNSLDTIKKFRKRMSKYASFDLVVQEWKSELNELLRGDAS